jgi:hypothetical protein
MLLKGPLGSARDIGARWYPVVAGGCFGVAQGKISSRCNCGFVSSLAGIVNFSLPTSLKWLHLIVIMEVSASIGSQ